MHRLCARRRCSRSRCQIFRAATALVLAALSSAAGVRYLEAQNALEKMPSLREPPPPWAYAINPPAEGSGTAAKPPDPTPRHVPDSEAVFTVEQTKDFFNPPDWHSAGQPVMPIIVARGRAPDVFACGYCHLPNGQGRPENSS